MEGSVLTPWGRSDRLRDRRLRPGPGYDRAEVERSQRERLFGAMVAVVDEVGYEGMSVTAVARRAGVSRSAVYEYFGGVQGCFVATFGALMEEGLAKVAAAYEHGDGAADERLGQALAVLFGEVVSQPAAGRLCFLEAYAAGPAAAALRDGATAALEGVVADAFDHFPDRAGMPAPVVTAITGGVRTLMQARLRRHREEELPALAPPLLDWMLAYRRPEPPLPRTHVRRPPESRFVAEGHRDRLFVALAKTVYAKGYAKTAVSDIAREASVSLSTFYEHFDGKEDAFLAACDFGIGQAFAAARHAWERERPNGWPRQVAAGMSELVSFLASEPEWSYVAMVEIFGAGARARARRDRTLELFTGLLEPGRELAPEVPPVTIEVLGGAVYALMYHRIRMRGAARLPEILPAALFVLLTPFVGHREAAAAIDSWSIGAES